MSEYYNPRRTKNLYTPGDSKPFKLSRSKIDLFIECPRCFYLDRRLGVGRPPGYPFTLNSAVDALLKKEFDGFREKGAKHPIILEYSVDAIPARHENLENWRNNFKGVQYHHPDTNLLIFGAIDDLWVNSKGEYIVVDYKATAKNEEITALDKDWHDGYKRQMEVYQWLFRQNEFSVSNTGYFVYANGNANLEEFDKKLEFALTLIPYDGNDSWIDETILQIFDCLNSNKYPRHSDSCDFCSYRKAVKDVIENGL